MASDVEMEGRRESTTPDLNLSPPPLSVSATTSRRSSLAHEGTGIAITNGHDTPSRGNSMSIPVLVHSPSPAPSGHDVSVVATSAEGGNSSVPPPSHSGTSGSTSGKPSSKPASSTTASAKPRSSKPAKARSPSPSPPPPPPVVPLQTVRLDIRLGGPSNYEVDISRQAKDTGQRPPTPPPVEKKVADSSDSEEEEEEKSKDGPSKPKRKKRKNNVSEFYDTSDPFIDDSELALDERQYFAQTKQQGFYVSSGEVALLKDKTPKKPKSKKISFASGLHPSLATDKKGLATATSTPHPSGTGTLPSIGDVPGTRDAPIPVDEESKYTLHSLAIKPDLSFAPGTNPAHAGQKRKRSKEGGGNGNAGSTAGTDANGNGKRKKVVDESVFHPDLQVAIRDMRELIAKESWEQKGKFPAGLKPPLAKLAVLAIRLDEYDDDFFSMMPTLFPYNKFTMTKLIKRTVFPDHMSLLTERQEVLLAQLAELAKAGFAKAEEEWEKSVLAWDKRQEKTRQDAAETSASTGATTPIRHPTEEMDVDGHPQPTLSAVTDIGEGAKDKDGKDKDGHSQHPPAKRYRMTEQMKAIIWELVLLSNECCRLENEKNSLEGSVIQISDQGLRKVLYQKIVAAYPEGWMSSGQISRDVSAMKKKLEREAAEQGEEVYF